MSSVDAGDVPAERGAGSSLKRLLVVALAVAAVLAALDVLSWRVVIAPLMAFAVWSVGTASLRSLRGGAAHIPDGDPVAIDPTEERTTYWCGGCGAELLLLVRGSSSPPRHCGERMHERREVRRES